VLGLDYKRGGFVDRAYEAFSEVLRFEPQNRYALINLQKLHEEQHQWPQARDVRQALVAISPEADQPRNRQILAFIEDELGRDDLKRGDQAAAATHFDAALDLDRATCRRTSTWATCEWLRGGRPRRRRRGPRDGSGAERAYLAFDRLESLYRAQQAPDRFHALCRRLIQANPKDWRAHLALARDLMARGRTAEALELLFEALSHSRTR